MFAVLLALAGVHGAVAVALGAYAAHGMEAVFDPEAVAWVETGSRYQMVHAAALIGTATGLRAAGSRAGRALLAAAGLLFALGALLFPGALYGLAFLQMPFFGAVAPFGGGALILGWMTLAAAGAAVRGRL